LRTSKSDEKYKYLVLWKYCTYLYRNTRSAVEHSLWNDSYKQVRYKIVITSYFYMHQFLMR